ncbi:MAG: hypothetical protein ACP5F3_02125 [Candidatus Syntrophosphaera sp.]
MQKVLVLLICAAVLAGCAASIYSTWNEDDARIVAGQLAEDILCGTWLREYYASNERMPVILLYKLENHSDESFPLHGFEDKLALNLLASGKVKLVLPREEYAGHDDFLKENLDSDLPIQDSGADLILKGSIHTLPDKTQLIFQLELLLSEAHGQKLLHRASMMHQKPLKQLKPRTT